jgi:polar amino acid transport system substrate-binding protein
MAQTMEQQAIPANTWVVDCYVFEPHVIVKDDGTVIGVQPDLIRMMAEDLDIKNVQFNVLRPKRFQEIFNGITADIPKATMLIGATTVTKERWHKYDFPYPYQTNAGLRIMARAEGQAQYLTIVKAIFSPTMFLCVLTFFAILFSMGFLVWRLEKNVGSIKTLKSGVEYTFCLLTTVGEGKYSAERKITFMLAVFAWLFATAFVVGPIIGNISSALTVENQDSKYTCLEDLRGETVVTVDGTYAHRVLETMDLGCRLELAESFEQACQMLDKETVEAVIYDADRLLYFANKVSEPGRFIIVGDKMAPQEYGFVLPPGSPLTPKVTDLIFKYKSNGTLNLIFNRYGL